MSAGASCPPRAYGAGMLARTRLMKATNSSSEWKCVICPETTCSTRPSQTNGAPGGWVRNCTTNARSVGSGSGSWGIGDLLQRPVRAGHVPVARGMPGREQIDVLTGDVLTPSAFAKMYFHMYSQRGTSYTPREGQARA